MIAPTPSFRKQAARPLRLLGISASTWAAGSLVGLGKHATGLKQLHHRPRARSQYWRIVASMCADLYEYRSPAAERGDGPEALKPSILQTKAGSILGSIGLEMPITSP